MATRRRALDLPRAALEAGDHVFLRRPTARDRRAFLDAVRASRALHRPWVSPPGDGGAWNAYLARLRRTSHAGFLVCTREARDLVGVINLNEIVYGALQSAYLGYYALAPHGGRGLMTEGMQLVLRHAFGRLGLHRLEANIQPENVRSIALVKRCGFEREGFSVRYLKVGGRWRDHERWALLCESWRESRGDP